MSDSMSAIKKTPVPSKTGTNAQPADPGTAAKELKDAVTPIPDAAARQSSKNIYNTELDFSKEKLYELQKMSEKLFVPLKEGETITVETRRKSYTGAFGGMAGGKMKIGLDLVPTIDLAQDIIDRANPDLMLKKQQDFLKDNYYIPKRESEMKLVVSKKESAQGQAE